MREATHALVCPHAEPDYGGHSGPPVSLFPVRVVACCIFLAPG
ncbi:hypothetical protein [Dactylosporangium sp. CA-233914]